MPAPPVTSAWPLAPEQAAIASAYTGLDFGHFAAFHKYAEAILGRPIFVTEFAREEIWRQLREASQPDFFQICGITGHGLDVPRG